MGIPLEELGVPGEFFHEFGRQINGKGRFKEAFLDIELNGVEDHRPEERGRNLHHHDQPWKPDQAAPKQSVEKNGQHGD